MKTISLLMRIALIINENKDDNGGNNKDNEDGNDDCNDENISPKTDNNNNYNDDNCIGSNGSKGDDNNNNRIKINDDNKNVTVPPVTIMMAVTMNINKWNNVDNGGNNKRINDNYVDDSDDSNNESGVDNDGIAVRKLHHKVSSRVS